MQNGEGHNAHLAKLSGLSFLVIDEADRMVQQGHFQVRSLVKPRGLEVLSVAVGDTCSAEGFTTTGGLSGN